MILCLLYLHTLVLVQYHIGITYRKHYLYSNKKKCMESFEMYYVNYKILTVACTYYFHIKLK